jgi:hypothetical protein
MTEAERIFDRLYGDIMAACTHLGTTYLFACPQATGIRAWLFFAPLHHICVKCGACATCAKAAAENV